MDPVISVREVVNRFGKQVVHDGLDVDGGSGAAAPVAPGAGPALGCHPEGGIL